ncbi:unnamed protein product, partial [Polarella glacialis]
MTTAMDDSDWAERRVAGRPWQQLPWEVPAGLSRNESGPHTLATQSTQATLSESGGCGSQAMAARRCHAFAPEPGAAGPQGPMLGTSSRQVGHTAVRRGALAGARQGGFLSVLQRWGQAGQLLEKLVDQWSPTSWLAIEHWLLSLLLCSLLAVRRKVLQLLGAWVEISDADLVSSEGFVQPVIAWHPDKDLFASLSPSGSLAVHCLGDALSGGASTQYLRGPEGPGVRSITSCLAWQPNDLRGALAVGGPGGVGLWRQGPAS